MSGVMVERRDHVLMTGGRWPPARAFSTAFRMPLSMNGPFLTERAISLHSGYLLSAPIFENHLLRALVAARLVTAGRLAPRRHRIAAAGGLAFAAAVRMVHRVHRHAADFRPQTFPTRSSCFAERNVFMLDVADLAHRRFANERHAPHFTRRHTQLRVVAFLRNQLSKRARRARHLSAFAGTQLDVVNLRAERDVDQRQRVAGKNVSLGAAHDRLTNFESGRRDDVRSEERRVGKECRARWWPYQ